MTLKHVKVEIKKPEFDELVHLTIRLEKKTMSEGRIMAEDVGIPLRTLLRHAVEYAMANTNFKILVKELYGDEDE
jgi:hypothetical protein